MDQMSVAEHGSGAATRHEHTAHARTRFQSHLALDKEEDDISNVATIEDGSALGKGVGLKHRKHVHLHVVGEMVARE